MLSPFSLSVVMPVFNGQKYIEEAIASVQKQRDCDLELIVVDDGSTDRTPEILQRMTGRVQVVRQDNAGPAAARNAGIRLAEGDWIGFLDADDLWPDDKLSLHLAQLKSAAHAEVVFGWTSAFRLGEDGKKRWEGAPHFFLNVGSALVKREVFEKVGLFDESLHYSEDVDWFMRARDKGIQIDFSQDPVLYYRLHPEGISQQRDPGSLQITQVLYKALQRKNR